MADTNITLIMKILASERTTIPYRPKLARVLGGVTAAILLQQIQYWWVRTDCLPFYKFNEPCDHPFYHTGDSWTEELGFTRSNLRTARQRIAIKKPEGTTMQEARLRTISSVPPKPVVFWTNAGRLTYYTIHPPALIKILRTAYLNTESDFSKIQKVLLGKGTKWNYLNPQSAFRITGDYTGDQPGEQQQQPKNVDVVDGWTLTDKFTPEQNNAFDDLLRVGVRPHAAAQLVTDHANGLGQIQRWIDYTEDIMVNDEQDIHNPAGFIIDGLRKGEAALLPIHEYRYGGGPVPCTVVQDSADRPALTVQDMCSGRCNNR